MSSAANQRLTTARLVAGLTQEQVAELANRATERATGRIGGMDADYISKLERGIHTWPNRVYRQALCSVLNTPDERALGFFCSRSRLGAEDRAPEQARELSGERRQETEQAEVQATTTQLSVGDDFAALLAAALALCSTSANGTPSQKQTTNDQFTDLRHVVDMLVEMMKRRCATRRLVVSPT